MLIEFTVGNYLSFHEKVNLSMLSTNITEFRKDNTIQCGRYKLLKSAVVYGANSSGKSNLVRAMSTMCNFVQSSVKQESTGSIPVIPFLLNKESCDEPSFFEMIFLVDDLRYRYGFEIDAKAVKSEWLFVSKIIAEKPLFIRVNDDIQLFKNFPEGKDLEPKTRSNALFLTVCDQFNGPIAKSIMKWFENFFPFSALQHNVMRKSTFTMLKDKAVRPLILEFFQGLDLGFTDIVVERTQANVNDLPDDMPDEIKNEIIKDMGNTEISRAKTSHQQFDSNRNPTGMVLFDLQRQESSGTKKIFNMAGSLFDALTDGGTLVLDEMDASVHPLLTLSITRLFNSAEHNKKNAQLIFTTHDTNLLTHGKLRRDQIYFMEKNPVGSSELYSLVEYKEDGNLTIRKDRSFEDDYIMGRYGGIPFLGNMSKIIESWQEK